MRINEAKIHIRLDNINLKKKAVNYSLPFVGMVITKTHNRLNTCDYRKKDQQIKGF